MYLPLAPAYDASHVASVDVEDPSAGLILSRDAAGSFLAAGLPTSPKWISGGGGPHDDR